MHKLGLLYGRVRRFTRNLVLSAQWVTPRVGGRRIMHALRNFRWRRRNNTVRLDQFYDAIDHGNDLSDYNICDAKLDYSFLKSAYSYSNLFILAGWTYVYIDRYSAEDGFNVPKGVFDITYSTEQLPSVVSHPRTPLQYDFRKTPA